MSLSRPLQGTAGPTLKGLKGAEFSSVVVLRAQVELGGSQGPALLSERPEPGCLGSVLRWAQARLAPPEPWFSPGTGLLREAARGPTRQAVLLAFLKLEQLVDRGAWKPGLQDPGMGGSSSVRLRA